MSRGAALAAAARGWAVFPVRPNGKRPAVPDHPEDECNRTDPRCRNGHQGWEPRATTDPERIARGWATTSYNVGVACGPSRLVVVDLDVPKPEDDKELPEEWRSLPGVSDGKDVFAQVCEWAGMDWPVTFTVATPSGGWHMYFAAPEGSGIRNSQPSPIGPMVDVRANGGYVVGAGSVTAAGAYEVLHDEPVTELPRWIARLLTPVSHPESNSPRSGLESARGDGTGGPGRLQGLVRTVAQAKPGTRNGALFWAGCRAAEMAAAGLADEREAARQLLAAAVSAGLSEQESVRTITSAMKGTR